jgi:membrane protein
VHQFAGLAKSKTGNLFTFSALVAVIAALWGLSGAFRAIMSATNAMQEVDETRSVWLRYGLSVALSLATGLLFLAAVALVVFGDRVAAAAGWGAPVVLAWRLARVPLLVTLVLPALAMTYYFAPNVKQPFRLVSIGSGVAFVLWLIFSKLFALYVASFVRYDASFGTLMGIAVLMLYLYYSACIVLLGAEIDCVLRRAR